MRQNFLYPFQKYCGIRKSQSTVKKIENITIKLPSMIGSIRYESISRFTSFY
jgi:hypothetical protein